MTILASQCLSNAFGADPLSVNCKIVLIDFCSYSRKLSMMLDVEGNMQKHTWYIIFYSYGICLKVDFLYPYLLAMHKRSIMDTIIKDIIDDARQ